MSRHAAVTIAVFSSMIAFSALAADAPATPAAPAAPVASAPKAVMPAPYGSIPEPGSSMVQPEAEPPTAGELPRNDFVTATLNDGSHVEFDSDGSVLVVAKDGTKTPAPDGMLTLKDGTPFVAKDGKRVSEY